MNFDRAAAKIRKEFIDKLFGYLAGKLQKVMNNKEFMAIYEVVVFQCDQADNGAKLYTFFQQIVKEYISEHALPRLHEKRE